MIPLDDISENHSTPVETHPGKTLNVISKLEPSQQYQLINMLQKHNSAFAWDYTDMKGVHPNLCTHHIYIKEDSQAISKPQRRMNPSLRDIVKEE
jgi:hypothetical protein